jgi:hypothetical protein
MVMATKRAIATAMVMTVAGDKEDNGDSSQNNSNGNKGGWLATASRVIETRVAGKRQ